MPLFALELKLNLENITKLRPEGSDFRWYIKLKCSSCGEQNDKWQYLTIEEKQEVDGSRGSANLVEKCKLCGRRNTVDIIQDSIGSYSVDKNREFQKIAVFECRGLEPTDFDPRVGWIAEGAESGTPFNEIDLGSKEWCEYDEKAQEAVGVYEWEHRFIPVKSK